MKASRRAFRVVAAREWTTRHERRGLGIEGDLALADDSLEAGTEPVARGLQEQAGRGLAGPVGGVAHGLSLGQHPKLVPLAKRLVVAIQHGGAPLVEPDALDSHAAGKGHPEQIHQHACHYDHLGSCHGLPDPWVASETRVDRSSNPRTRASASGCTPPRSRATWSARSTTSPSPRRAKASAVRKTPSTEPWPRARTSAVR